MSEDAANKQVRMRIQDNNALATNANAHELTLDFGINVDSRIVMNYTTAKRRAGFLNQLIQAHEQRFGEIKTELTTPPKPYRIAGAPRPPLTVAEVGPTSGPK